MTVPAGAVTTREQQILDLLSRHLTNAEIAAQLFISVRTVESHVSSLLRKLGVADRRSLAVLASRRPPSAARRCRRVPTAFPAPLTPFIGRTGERAELAAALRTRRLVSAVGPGGVGKTRLALAVAAELARRPVRGRGVVRRSRARARRCEHRTDPRGRPRAR